MKLKQLQEQDLPADIYDAAYHKVIEKDCLCEGLAVPALLKEGIPVPHKLKAVTICPGPNLAYFSGTFSFREMVDHIYGRKNILNSLPRPHMFINELNLYVDYFKNLAGDFSLELKQVKGLAAFKNNLLDGIDYYKKLSQTFLLSMLDDLTAAEDKLRCIVVPAR